MKDCVLLAGMDPGDQEIGVVLPATSPCPSAGGVDGVVIWVVVELRDATFRLADDDGLVRARWGRWWGNLRGTALLLHSRTTR